MAQAPNVYGGAAFDWNLYKECRPIYPDELFEILGRYANYSKDREVPLAIDYGTATGTIVPDIFERYAVRKVVGTDINEESLAEGVVLLKEKGYDQDRYTTLQARAGDLHHISDASVDLITSAEAAHWFDHSKWVTECARILRPGGTLAFWFYTFWCQILDAPEAVAPLNRIWQRIVALMYKKAGGKIPLSLVYAGLSCLDSIVVPEDCFYKQVRIRRTLPDAVMSQITDERPELTLTDKAGAQQHLRDGLVNGGEDMVIDVETAKDASDVFMRSSGWDINALLKYIETVNLASMQDLLADPEVIQDLDKIREATAQKQGRFDVGWDFGMVLATRR